MLPIFNDYINFLEDKGIPIKLKEGYYWTDKQIIKSFDENGNIQKVLRMKIDDNLNVSFSEYKTKCNEPISWEETYKLFSSSIDEKISEADNVIKNALEKYKDKQWVLTTSKGKDSNLTEWFLNKNGVKYRKIFNNTTLDCADVYKEVRKDSSIEIVTPKMPTGENRSFYRMVKLHGVPSRHHRWCCSYFKEGGTKQYFDGVHDLLFVMGMRNEESATRSSYGFEWENEQWADKTWSGLLPIKNFTELELWLLEIHNGIAINNKYKKGYRRCGCHIACPFYTKSTWILDKYWYSVQYQRWHDILTEDFQKEEKWTRINCTLKEYHTNWNGGIVREEPTDEVVDGFMEYKGFENREVAEKYFNKTCLKCGKKVYHKNEISMNLKFIGRNIDKFMCKKCLMKEIGLTEEDWNAYIKRFKESGCALF